MRNHCPTNRQVLVRVVLLAMLSLVSALHGEARRTGDIYIWRNSANTDVNTQELISAWVPDTTAVVRGFFFMGSWGGCPGADARPWAVGDTAWHRFAAHFGFGCMGVTHMCGTEYNMKNTNLLLQALNEMSAIGPNVEIRNVPLIPWGNSNSSATGYSLVSLMPDKILCAFLNVTAGYDPNPPTAGGIMVPVVFTTGENDYQRSTIGPLVAAARARGALWGYAEVQGMAHEVWRVFHVARPFFEKCIALRYPSNASPRTAQVVLNPIAESSGWLGTTDWRTTLASEYAYDSFPGTKAAANWWVDKDIAYLARNLCAWNTSVNPSDQLTMTVAGQRTPWGKPDDTITTAAPGTQVALAYVPSGFAWNRLEFYRGSTIIGQVTSGSPQLAFTLSAGAFAQSFSVIAYSAAGGRQTSPAFNVVVAGPETSARQTNARATSRAVAPAAARSFDLRGRCVGAPLQSAPPGRAQGLVVEVRQGKATLVERR